MGKGGAGRAGVGARGEARAQWGGAARQEHGGALGCGGEQWRRQLGLGQTARLRRKKNLVVRLSSPNAIEKKIEKSPEDTRDPLTGRSGGSDRTLPPSVRSIPERSKTSGIGTGRVRWSMTRRRQGPIRTT